MKKFTVTTLYYIDGVFAYYESRKGQSHFMARRAKYNEKNSIGQWTKKVVITEEEVSE